MKIFKADIDIIIIIPPIVGVPAFFKWLFGPSSRTYCPNFNLFKNGMTRGLKPALTKNAANAGNSISYGIFIKAPLHFLIWYLLFYDIFSDRTCHFSIMLLPSFIKYSL